MHRTFGSWRWQSQNHSNLDVTLIWHTKKICREILRKQQKKYYENVNLVLVNAAINHTKLTHKKMILCMYISWCCLHTFKNVKKAKQTTTTNKKRWGFFTWKLTLFSSRQCHQWMGAWRSMTGRRGLTKQNKSSCKQNSVTVHFQ